MTGTVFVTRTPIGDVKGVFGLPQVEVETEELPEDHADVVAFLNPPITDASNTLSPVRFRYLLALTGWEDVWASVEAYLKENDRTAYAGLTAQKNAQTFRLSVTLQFLASVKPITNQLHPDVDLSETTVRAKWAEAQATKI